MAASRLVSRLGMFSQISEIDDNLFLSGVQPIRSDRLRQKKITSVVNATVDEPSIAVQGVSYLKVRVEDSPYAHLDAYFDLVADHIKKEIEKGGKVLVHCVAGVSRSAALILAYLIKHEGMTLKEAYWKVKSIRPIIRPNIGFWRQLIHYEEHVRGGKPTVKVVPSKWGDEVPDVYTEEVRLNPRPLPGLSSSQSTYATSSLMRTPRRSITIPSGFATTSRSSPVRSPTKISTRSLLSSISSFYNSDYLLPRI